MLGKFLLDTQHLFLYNSQKTDPLSAQVDHGMHDRIEGGNSRKCINLSALKGRDAGVFWKGVFIVKRRGFPPYEQ